MLDHAAGKLLGGTYQDLLSWDPANTGALQRPGPLATVSSALADGIASNDLKVAVQQWLSHIQSGFRVLPPASGAQLHVEGPYLYRVHGAGLDVVDVSDSSQPVHIGALDFGGSRFPRAQHTVWQGSYVYATTQPGVIQPSVLRVMDVGDPHNPVQMATLDLPGEARFLAGTGDYLFVGVTQSDPTWYRAVIVIDIRNPQQPVRVAERVLEESLVDGVLAGQHLFIRTSAGLTVVDVSNPLAPVAAARLQEGRLLGPMAAADGRLYVGEPGPSLVIFDISNPLAPVISSRLVFEWHANYRTIASLQPRGNDLYVNVSGAIHQIDVSDPAAPRWVSTLNASFYNIHGLAVGPDHLYVDRGSELDILGLSDVLEAPALAGSVNVPGGVAENVAASEQVAYAPVHSRGIWMIDLRRPRAPALLGMDLRFDEVFAIAFNGTVAYLGDQQHFHVVDSSDPGNPRELPGTFALQERGYDSANGMAMTGNHVYLSTQGQGEDWARTWLLALDLQDPGMPRLSAQIPLGLLESLATAAGDKAYIGTQEGDSAALQIVDISNPALPQPVGDTLPVPQSIAAATEDYLYVVSRQDGELLVVDVRDPARPELVNRVATAWTVTGMTLANGYLLLANAGAGIMLLDLGDPAAPVILGNAAVRGHANGAFVQNGLLYAATTMGLDVLKVPSQ